MNRGVMVTRGKPDEKELILSARLVIVICSIEILCNYTISIEE